MLEPIRKEGPTNGYPRNGKRFRGQQHKRWERELKLTTGPKCGGDHSQQAHSAEKYLITNL